MEVLVGANARMEMGTRELLRRFVLVDLNAMIAEHAVVLCRKHRLRLTDAVIWASAQVRGLLLVTRTTKDFSRNDPGVRAPYTIQ